MYRNTPYKRNITRPQHLLYKIAARDPRLIKQAKNFALARKVIGGILGAPYKGWRRLDKLMAPSLSMHPKRMGWWGRTFGDRLKVQRNAQAIETARAARAFSKAQRDRTFLRMREQLPNAAGQRRAELEANMAAFDPATGWTRGKYFMQRAPDGKMHARKNRVQGMNQFTDFLNKGTAPQGTGATAAAQQAARQTQQAASNTAQQAAANTAQSASRAQQAASNTAQAAEQAANTAQQAASTARPRPMKRPSGQTMSAAQWARTRQGRQELARRQAKNRAAREAQQATQQAARSSDFNFRQPVDNGSFGPSFRQPVNNGGFGANFRQPVGQGNYSIAADNAFNTLSGRTAAPRRAPRYAMPSQAEIRAGANATYLRDRENLASLGIGRRGRGASSTPVIHRNSTDQATERAAQNFREQILGRNRQAEDIARRQAEQAAREMNAHKSMPGLGGLDPLRGFTPAREMNAHKSMPGLGGLDPLRGFTPAREMNAQTPAISAMKGILGNKFSDGQTFKFNPYIDDPNKAIKLINIMRGKYKHNSDDYRRLMALRQILQAEINS